MRTSLIASFALTFLFVFTVDLATPSQSQRGAGLLQFTTAKAAPRHRARRVTRRTARRTTRRVVRRTSVAGCALRRPYYYCGGVYYRAVVEGGRTVYVVVYP